MRDLLLLLLLVALFVAVSGLIPDPALRRHLLRQVRRRSRVQAERRLDSRRLRLRRAQRASHSPLAVQLQPRLAAAGLELLPNEALLIAAGVGLVLLLLLLPLFGPLAVLLAPLAVLFGGQALLRQRIAQRRRALARLLPEALQILAQGVRSGHALPQTIAVAAREVADPLGGELKRVAEEVRLGVPFEEALQAFAARIGSRDVDLLVTAVLVQRQVGGNLAELLDRLQATLRDRLKLEGEVHALTAQGRLSGLIVGLLPPGIAVVASMLNPGFLTPLYATSLGHVLLLLSAFLEAVGLYAIHRIVQVDV
jgi:tight adherence protein B